MDAVLGDLANRLETALPAWVLADMHNTVWLLAAAAALLPPLATYTIWMLIKSLLPPMPPRRLKTTHPGNCCITCSTGGYEALQVRALPADTATQGAVPEGHTPIPPEDLVTVRVQAAGVNYADICIRWGLYASWNKFGGGTGTCTTTSRDCSSEASAIQNVPGFEFAGIVEAIGSSVTNVKVGDEIFGVTLFGAYTCRLVVPAHQVFRRPRGLKPSQAAALPAVAMTAYFAVMRQASPISPGEPVLIHSGAGGVGSMLIQMCRIQGWRVCAVVGSSHKVSACVELGADCVIDKSTSDLWAQARTFAPRGFAAVFDANGVATLQQSWEHLAPCGKLIVYGFHTMLPKQGGRIGPMHWLRIARDYLRTPRFNPLEMTSANKSVLAFNLSFLFDRRDIFEPAMQEILNWVANGKLRVPAVATYPLVDVCIAHAALESGKTVGKLALIPDSVGVQPAPAEAGDE